MSCWSTSLSAASRRACALTSSGSPLTNSVSRTACKTSLSVKTVLPTTTAMRSTTSAESSAEPASNKAAMRNPILECLSNVEEELEMSGVLDGGLRAAEEQLLGGALEPLERGRIERVSEVHRDRPERRFVADTEPDGVHHVIEVRDVFLVDAEGKCAHARKNVAEIVKEHALHVGAEEREAQFRGVEKERVAAERETGHRIARAGLIFGKAAHGAFASAEETLGKRHIILGRNAAGVVRMKDAELGVAGQNELRGDGMVVRIAQQQPREIAVAAELTGGKA